MTPVVFLSLFAPRLPSQLQMEPDLHPIYYLLPSQPKYTPSVELRTLSAKLRIQESSVLPSPDSRVSDPAMCFQKACAASLMEAIDGRSELNLTFGSPPVAHAYINTFLDYFSQSDCRYRPVHQKVHRHPGKRHALLL